MNLSLWGLDEYAGEFVIRDGDKFYSIGDYIEVTLTSQPYDTGERRENTLTGKDQSIWVFPLIVQFSSESEPFECALHISDDRIGRHWYECLEVGKIQTIRAIKCSIRQFTWWIPEIDGYKPGMFGKVKK